VRTANGNSPGPWKQYETWRRFTWWVDRQAPPVEMAQRRWPGLLRKRKWNAEPQRRNNAHAINWEAIASKGWATNARGSRQKQEPEGSHNRFVICASANWVAHSWNQLCAGERSGHHRHDWNFDTATLIADLLAHGTSHDGAVVFVPIESFANSAANHRHRPNGAVGGASIRGAL